MTLKKIKTKDQKGDAVTNPIHIVSTPFGVHYFTRGQATLSKEALKHLEDQGAQFEEGKPEKPGEYLEPGNPYSQKALLENPPSEQEPAQNPNEPNESKMTPEEKMHAGVPQFAGNAPAAHDHPRLASEGMKGTKDEQSAKPPKATPSK